MIVDVISFTLLLSGSVLMLVSALGVLRFPGAVARLHAATKAATGGLVLVSAGAGVALGGASLTLVVLVVLFQLFTAPIAGHILGRAAIAANPPNERNLVHDDFADGVEITRAGTRQTGRGLPFGSLITLTIAWCMLWGDFSAGNIVGGVLAAAAVLAVTGARRTPLALRPIGLARLFLVFIGAMVRGTIDVAAEVLTRDDSTIRQAVVRVDLPGRTLEALVLTAATVTLTPGSLAVELDARNQAIYVHVLHYDEASTRADVERLADSAMAALRVPTP